MKSEAAFGLENAGWPALLVDEGGVIRRANSAALKLFGSAVEGHTALLASISGPENNGTAEQFLAQWERSPVPSVSLKLRAKGGAALSFAAFLCAFTKDGQKFFILQFTGDSQVEKDPRNPGADSAAAQKQKLDCALQLARTVALDFNNALTSILGHTSLVLSKMEPNNPWRGSLLEVEKSAARAAEIASDLGSFSRQEKEGRGQSTGNLNLQVQRCVEYFQRNAGPQPVSWESHLERKLFAVKFDEAKIQQALLRILENSVQALQGAGRISVQTRNLDLTEATQDRNVKLAVGAYVCVEISDNGCGIPADVLLRIFEPFFTTKPAPHRGLGLAWVYGIITNHGGGVAVSSQPGSGTSVRLYLPAEKTVIRDSGAPGEGLRGTGTILMVDDEDLLLTMGETILSSFGYNVLTANSGQKALEILGRDDAKVDLLITDLVMPAMSGRELVEHVAALAPHVRILCTSGYIWPACHENETAYLQKPFTTQELLLKVKQVLA